MKTKEEQEGDKRGQEGSNSAQEDPKGKQKEAKRAQSGGMRPLEGWEGGKGGPDKLIRRLLHSFVWP